MSSENRFALFGITPDGRLTRKGPETSGHDQTPGRSMLCLLYGEGKRGRGIDASNMRNFIDERFIAALQLQILRAYNFATTSW